MNKVSIHKELALKTETEKMINPKILPMRLDKQYYGEKLMFKILNKKRELIITKDNKFEFECTPDLYYEADNTFLYKCVKTKDNEERIWRVNDKKILDKNFIYNYMLEENIEFYLYNKKYICRRSRKKPFSF